MADAIYDLGAIRIAWQGAYAGGTTYYPLDAVFYNGSSYICILQSTGNDPTNTTYWQLLASIGDQGEQGIQGIQGIQGEQGDGDMNKSVYDTDDDGKVDAAEDADALGGVAADHYEEQEAITTGGSANAYAVTTGRSYTAYFTGMSLKVKIHAASTATSITVAVDGLSAKAVKAFGSDNVEQADFFKLGMVCYLMYDGTNFIIVNYSPGGWKIGDISQTARTDLGSDWLLCNGAAVDGGTYPDLYDLIEPANGLDSTPVDSNAIGNYNMYDIAYGGTTYVAVGQDGKIYYTTDPTGSWSSTDKGTKVFEAVCWNGTYFVAVGYEGILAYSTNGSSWTNNNQSTTADFRGIVWDGTNFAAICNYGGSCRIYYTTDPTGSWSSHVVDASRDGWSICYGNGYYLISYKYNVAYSTSITGTWTTYSADFYPPKVYYEGGKFFYIRAGEVWVNNTDGDPSSFTKYTPTTAPSPATGDTCYGRYSSKLGKWIVTVKSTTYYYTDDLTGEWTTNDCGTGTVRSVCCTDDFIVFVGNIDSFEASLSTIDIKSYLPNISVDNAYAYIKALE